MNKNSEASSETGPSRGGRAEMAKIGFTCEAGRMLGKIFFMLSVALVKIRTTQREEARAGKLSAAKP